MDIPAHNTQFCACLGIRRLPAVEYENGICLKDAIIMGLNEVRTDRHGHHTLDSTIAHV